MNAPIAVPAPDEVIATVRNSADLVEAFRAMQNMLGMTNAQCDDLANLTGGHTDKLLGPTQSKSIGALTFNAFCWMFAVQFEMKIDLDAAKRMQEHWEDRKRLRPAEYSENGRVSKKLLEKAKPLVLKERAKLANAVRNTLLTSEQRIKIAKKAAKKSSRTSQLPAERQTEIARKAVNARWERRRQADAQASIICSSVSVKPL